ncbi:MAG: glycosyltransferase [Verrucomicrobiota bacterium]|jgi:glycosyltransferase involved in cell wall biosynthesis
MKVLFFNSPPFFLAHGGMQTLTEALMRELAGLGVEVEPERWWDENQKGDIIHYIGRPVALTVRAAHQKGFKVIMTENLGQTASRGWKRRFAQRALTDLARRALPGGFLDRLGWEVYQELDAMVYVVEHEWETAKYLFHASPERGHIIPHGLEPEALTELARPQKPEDYLVCMASIYPVKNNVLLARAAQLAGTPIVFLGKPYAEDDSYFLEFKQCVDGKVVRYAGFAAGEDKNRWLRGARGFVLLSQYESGCIAVYEAAAAGLPLLLTDLPWANKVYGQVPAAKFVGLGPPQRIAPALKRFYEQAHRQASATFPLLTWRQVAARYLEVYRKILGGA